MDLSAIPYETLSKELLVSIFGSIYPFENLARGKRYEAMNVATGKVAERWWDYAGKRWGSTVVRIAQNENIYKLVLDLMRVSKAKQLPGVTEVADAFNLGYIRQELMFYAKALQSELFTDYTEQQVWDAIHCAVIAWMVLEQRRAYWNLLGELTDFIGLPCEQDEPDAEWSWVKQSDGKFVPIRVDLEITYPHTGVHVLVRHLADYADLLWDQGDIYVMTEAVQGIDWLPLKNVIRFYRYYYQAYLKEVREADIVNTVVMTVWYIGLGYVTAGNLGQLLGSERTGKLLKFAKDTGGWIYTQVKRLVGPMADALLDAYLKSLQPTIPTTPIVPPKEEEEKKDNTALIVGAIAALLVLGSKQ